MSESSLPETVTLTLEGDVALALQRIDPGAFCMGSRGNDPSEEPVHRVVITHPFFLGITPVTQAQFSEWTRACGIDHENGFPDRPDHPAENLDWFQAVAFCHWLNETNSAEIPPGYRVGLPTEAEWEYACRGGPHTSTTDYWSGDGEAALSSVGWWAGISGGCTHPVGSFGAAGRNPCGLWDMHGNVWEWCDDGWDQTAYRRRIDGVADPWIVVPSAGSHAGLRAIRGSAWFGKAKKCASASRFWRSPKVRFNDLGVRVSLIPAEVKRNCFEPSASEQSEN